MEKAKFKILLIFRIGKGHKRTFKDIGSGLLFKLGGRYMGVEFLKLFYFIFLSVSFHMYYILF